MGDGKQILSWWFAIKFSTCSNLKAKG